jgi:hypothetical protein
MEETEAQPKGILFCSPLFPHGAVYVSEHFFFFFVFLGSGGKKGGDEDEDDADLKKLRAGLTGKAQSD